MDELKESGRRVKARKATAVRVHLNGLRSLFWVFAAIAAGLALAEDRTPAGVLTIAATVVVVLGLMQGRRKP